MYGAHTNAQGSKIGSAASEEKLFENVYGWAHETDTQTDKGQKVITIAHNEHSSGELTMLENVPRVSSCLKIFYDLFLPIDRAWYILL